MFGRHGNRSVSTQRKEALPARVFPKQGRGGRTANRTSDRRNGVIYEPQIAQWHFEKGTGERNVLRGARGNGNPRRGNARTSRASRRCGSEVERSASCDRKAAVRGGQGPPSG